MPSLYQCSAVPAEAGSFRLRRNRICFAYISVAFPASRKRRVSRQKTPLAPIPYTKIILLTSTYPSSLFHQSPPSAPREAQKSTSDIPPIPTNRNEVLKKALLKRFVTSDTDIPDIRSGRRTRVSDETQEICNRKNRTLPRKPSASPRDAARKAQRLRQRSGFQGIQSHFGILQKKLIFVPIRRYGKRFPQNSSKERNP